YFVPGLSHSGVVQSDSCCEIPISLAIGDMRQLPAFPHLRFRPTSRLADLGAKSPSIELLQKVRLTGPWVPLQMIADQSTWCNSRWSGAVLWPPNRERGQL